MSVTVTSAPFNLELVDGNRPRITRDLEFSNGDTISFSITLEQDIHATIPQLHRNSVRELINRLEAWIGPE
jgi:hypothetical protein